MASAQLLMAADAGGNRARQVFQGLGVGALYKALTGLAKLWPDIADLKVQIERGVLIGSGSFAGEGLTGVAIALWAFLAGSKPQGLGIHYPGHLGEVISLLAYGLLAYALLAYGLLAYALVWTSRKTVTAT